MQAITPDAHGIAVLLLTVVALYLFTRDNIPLESSSFAILIILTAGFTLFPYADIEGNVIVGPVDFFAGFGNEALVAICALMMVGKALETTGALQPLATIVGKAWATRPVLALVTTLVAGAILSAFMNNTPIVVLLMPILVGASLRSKFPVSEVMLPMGLATIVGGMSTTIGTSTNLLVVGISQDLGEHEFTMFEFVLPVAIVGGAAIAFLWLVAPKLLPDRAPPMADTTPRVFSAQLHVKEGAEHVQRKGKAKKAGKPAALIPENIHAFEKPTAPVVRTVEIPDAISVSDLAQKMAVKAGDKVLFGKYSGTEVQVDGDDLLVMREDDIMGILDA